MARISDEVLDLLGSHAWEDTIAKLIHYAMRKIKRKYWLGIFDGSAPAGAEAEDIIMTSITKVFNGERNWDPQKQPNLFLYLKDVVDSEINHLVEGWENTHFRRGASLSVNSYESDNKTDFWETVPDPAISTEEALINQVTEAQSEKFFWDFHAALGDEPRLQGVLEGLVEGHIKRADIAIFMDIPVREIDNLKKQLQRRLKSFQDARSGGANE